MGLEPGLEARVTQEVTAKDTASALGSGDVDVFGTPAVVALCERAAVAAVAPHLTDDQTTVGIRIELDHLAPTLPGRRVEAHAHLDRVEGRILHFTVEATDGAGVIARGRHSRALVGRLRFLESAAGRG